MSEPREGDHHRIDSNTAREIEAALAAEHLRITRFEPQLRRFARALADLGAPVPRDWARRDRDDTVSFTDLTPEQFDRLICLFEQIADHRCDTGGPGPDACDDPRRAPATASHVGIHMEVPR